MDKGSAVRWMTTSKVVIAALLGCGLGLLLLYVSGRDDWMAGLGGLQSVLENLGGLLIASIMLGSLWELVGKRSFAREVLASARVAADVTTAGLTAIGTNYLSDPDWERLFQEVQKLDIFFAYGRTWRNSNDANLKALVGRRGTRIRVFLPNPGDPDTVKWLADRFQMQQEVLRAAIEESRDYFVQLGQGARGNVQVYYRNGDSTFSCYRFDRTAIITMYTHRRERTQVPTVACREPGNLYEFVRSELRSIEAQSQIA